MAKDIKSWLDQPRKPLGGSEAAQGLKELDRLVKAEKAGKR